MYICHQLQKEMQDQRTNSNNNDDIVVSSLEPLLNIAKERCTFIRLLIKSHYET
jgi:hypothetical protein